MADESGIKPVSRSELYQYVSAQLRRNFAADPLDIYRAFLRTGREVSQGIFNQIQALAAYNVGRSQQIPQYLDNQTLPEEAYELSAATGRNKYRVTALAEVIEQGTGRTMQRAITISSARSQSPLGWLDMAIAALQTYEQRYRYRVQDIQIVNPRMRE